MASLKRLRPSMRVILGVTAVILVLAGRIDAHEHDEDEIPEGETVSPDPIDVKLWIHILLQITTWGIIFPTGMVLGIIKSRWHVPVQVFGTVLAAVGHWLGHHHGGRQFKHNVHSFFAPIIGLMLASQVILGIYLRLHIERGFLGKIRKVLVHVHGVVGKVLPVVAWVQMLFGGITALGFCQGDHLGQCAAHFIMGSAFIGYGIVLTLLLLVGQFWLHKTGRSQEFFDSLVIAVWGCVNTFTEHRWGGPWVRNDLQHTSMGIIWWCAGLLGVWLSRTRDGRPKRNIIPAIVILLTGYGMSAHPQELMLSTMVHSFFGYSLMAAGAARIVEISFILKDAPAIDMTGKDPNSFQYLTPFLLIASGFLFMGATEEQMIMMSGAHVTHVSYIFILYSLAFLMFLFVNVLLHLYAVNTPPSDETSPYPRLDEEAYTSFDELPSTTRLHPQANGHAHANGALPERERRRAKDAEEFELDQLISESEDEDELGRGEKGKGKGKGKTSAVVGADGDGDLLRLR